MAKEGVNRLQASSYNSLGLCRSQPCWRLEGGDPRAIACRASSYKVSSCKAGHGQTKVMLLFTISWSISNCACAVLWFHTL
jgi:hypothetical protein